LIRKGKTMLKINLNEFNMFSVRFSTPTLGEYQFRDIVAKDITDAYVKVMSKRTKLTYNIVITRENVLEVAKSYGYTLTDITAECMPTHTIIGGKN